MEETKIHRSGFVNIIGHPNVGKSTLTNALTGEQMSIVTAKPQTTRHRILGILSGEDFQIVFSDTPGVIQQPSYKMQQAMNKFAFSTFEDADLMLFMTDTQEIYAEDDQMLQRLAQVQDFPLFVVVNKVDLVSANQVLGILELWKMRLPNAKAFIPISALQKQNTDVLLQQIIAHLPEGPEYYPKDELSDRPERFFATEIVREQILELYHQEIPYSCEVVIESFKEDTTNDGKPLTRIGVLIFVSRESQKGIMLGHQGKSIKELGTRSRKRLEAFLDRKVFLEMHIKIKKDWRDDDNSLRQFGYV